MAGFVILARRGMAQVFVREAQRSGAAVRLIDVRSDMGSGRCEVAFQRLPMDLGCPLIKSQLTATA